MTSELTRFNLKIIHRYKFDGPHCEDERKDADVAIINFINKFLIEYKHLLKMNYSIIIDYNNNIYDYLAYKLLKNISPLTTVKPEIYIAGVCESPEETALFKEEKIIPKKKIKKFKKAIYVTGHHPIYNVKNFNEISKQFSTIINPIESFTPCQINQLIDFYVEKENPLYTTINNNSWLYRFYQFPVGLKDLDITIDLNYHAENTTIYLFKLSGTEQDFKCFDFIIKKDTEDKNSIFLYLVDSAAAADEIKLNLNPYMTRYHAPNKFNTILSTNEIFHPTYTYNYSEFLEGQK